MENVPDVLCLDQFNFISWNLNIFFLAFGAVLLCGLGPCLQQVGCATPISDLALFLSAKTVWGSN
jgi:hypothetical protein